MSTYEGNKEYLVTVEVTFRKKYLVMAIDGERAEDYGVDEAYGDVYSIYNEDCSVNVSDVETV